eukprot:500092-Pelagomonas_calceolata.AAC.15
MGACKCSLCNANSSISSYPAYVHKRSSVLNIYTKAPICPFSMAPREMGAMPQEDYAEAVHGTMIPFLEGATDVWVSGKMMKMTNKGGVEVD